MLETACLEEGDYRIENRNSYSATQELGKDLKLFTATNFEHFNHYIGGLIEK